MMSLDKAEDINRWRRDGLTWRKISELYCDKYKESCAVDIHLRGNLNHGLDLCMRAAKFLGNENSDHW